MKSDLLRYALILVIVTSFVSCHNESQMDTEREKGNMTVKDRLDQYTDFALEADLSSLSENQRKMIPILIDAAKAMDEVFWIEAYGDKGQLMDMISSPEARRFAEINYGPWDRLNGNVPFFEDAGPKAEGANFYPADMTKEDFESWDSEVKDDLYTLVRRDENGELMTVPYHQAFVESIWIKEAAKLAENDALKKYLAGRSVAH